MRKTYFVVTIDASGILKPVINNKHIIKFLTIDESVAIAERLYMTTGRSYEVFELGCGVTSR